MILKNPMITMDTLRDLLTLSDSYSWFLFTLKIQPKKKFMNGYQFCWLIGKKIYHSLFYRYLFIRLFAEIALNFKDIDLSEYDSWIYNQNVLDTFHSKCG